MTSRTASTFGGTDTVLCTHCGAENEGVTAYCRRCARVLPQAARRTLRSSPESLPPRRKVPVSRPTERLVPAWRRHWPKAFLGAAVLLCLWTLRWFFSIDEQLAMSGHHFTSFSLDRDPRFFIGFEENVKSWSQIGEALDTPLQQVKALETGVLHLSHPGNPRQIVVTAESWIRTEEEGDNGRAISIPVHDPSIRPVVADLDAFGRVEQFMGYESTRTGQALPYLFPLWPDRPLRRGETWEEKAEWTDVSVGWAIHWTATRQWRLEGYGPCRDSHCARFSYEAVLTPVLVKTPPWAARRAGAPRFSGHGSGSAIVDAFNNRPVENTFHFSGDLQIPFSDLRMIPEELRIAPIDHDTPGEIVIRLDKKVSLTRP